MDRPRSVSLALYATMALGIATLGFRAYLASVVIAHDAAPATLLLAAEALVLGALPIGLAAAALRPRPTAHVALQAVYVLGLLDAAAWLVFTPPFGLLIAILMGAGHGADEDGADAMIVFTLGRVAWVIFKIVLLGGMFWVLRRAGRAWLDAARAT